MFNVLNFTGSPRFGFGKKEADTGVQRFEKLRTNRIAAAKPGDRAIISERKA